MVSMLLTMKYCVIKSKHVMTLRPGTKWIGDINFEFVIRGKFYSGYAKWPYTRKSLSGYITFLCGEVVTDKILMQRTAALSVSEAKIFSSTQCTQCMIYVYILINNVGLKVNLNINNEVDNQGAVYLDNDWSVGGRTFHVEEYQYLIREL